MKLFDNNIKTLEKSLDAYSTRSKLLANNIANVNTPNYKRQDIQFKNILNEALESDGNSIRGKTTHSGHMSINPKPELETVAPKIVTENGTTMRNDGNNVDIEKEQAEFAKNNINYKMATSRISLEFRLLKTVIKSK